MNIKKLSNLLLLFVILPSISLAGSRAFSERFLLDTRGNFEYIGNTQLVCLSNCSSNAHNYVTLGYADVDGDSSTFNSSSANLQIPTGAKIEWAGLYWGGTVNISSAYPNIINSPSPSSRGTVKFKTPNSTTYTNINATVIDTIAGTPVLGWEAYQAFADVTDVIKNTGSGDYFVADLQVDRGGDTSGNSFTGASGGWNLVVIYSSSSEKFRRFNVWDGYDHVFFSSANKIFNVNNIRTPLSGSFESEVAFSCFDGERVNLNGGGFDGDFIAINNTSNKLSDGLNSTDNICNGSISKHGVDLTNRSPADTNTWGYDLDRINISNSGYIPNNTNALDVIFGSSNEGIWFGNVVFSTEIFPSIAIEKTVNGSAAPADWQFTLSSNNCSLPSGLSNPISVSGAGGTAVFNDLPVTQSSTTCQYSISESTQTGYSLNTTTSDSLANITLDSNQVKTIRITNDATVLDDLTNCFSIVSANQTDDDTVDNNQCVTLLAASTSSIPQPVADYRFDECSWNGSNNEVIDSSGNGLHGKSISGANISSSGKFYRSGVFNGSNNYVQIDNNAKLQLTTDMSLSLWVNPNVLSGRQGLIFKHYNNEYEIILESSGSLSFYHGNNSWEEMQEPSSAKISANQWSHVIITRDHANKTLKWYINGTLKGSDTYVSNPVASSNIVKIGQRSSSAAFSGKIDEVKFFDKSLTDTEVQEIYNNENSGKNYDGTNRTPPSCTASSALRATASNTVEITPSGLLSWRSVWINEGLAEAPYVEITAEVPAGTQFVPLPAGQYTSGDGIYCEARGDSIESESCYYEAPTENFTQGRIIWKGTIISEPESSEVRKLRSTTTTRAGEIESIENLAENEVVIRFVTLPTGEQSIITGQAYSDWYINGKTNDEIEPDRRVHAIDPSTNDPDVPTSTEIDPSLYSFVTSMKPIPTMSEWSLIILSLLMLLMGLLLHRRRRF